MVDFDKLKVGRIIDTEHRENALYLVGKWVFLADSREKIGGIIGKLVEIRNNSTYGYGFRFKSGEGTTIYSYIAEIIDENDGAISPTTGEEPVW